MGIWIALILLLSLILFTFTKKEGFDPFIPELKPDGYPDQRFSGDLILAEKYVQKLLNMTNDVEKTKYLNDFLNLLQFI